MSFIVATLAKGFHVFSIPADMVSGLMSGFHVRPHVRVYVPVNVMDFLKKSRAWVASKGYHRALHCHQIKPISGGTPAALDVLRRAHHAPRLKLAKIPARLPLAAPAKRCHLFHSGVRIFPAQLPPKAMRYQATKLPDKRLRQRVSRARKRRLNVLR
jgi:hypothetical protein